MTKETTDIIAALDQQRDAIHTITGDFRSTELENVMGRAISQLKLLERSLEWTEQFKAEDRARTSRT